LAIRIDIKAPSFPETVNDLFNILTDNVNMTYVDIDFENQRITFKQASGHSDLQVKVDADEALDRFDLIAFLVTPHMVDFGHEAWLSEQFEQYPIRLVIYNADNSPTADTSLSK
jgi:hypothetical protein